MFSLYAISAAPPANGTVGRFAGSYIPGNHVRRFTVSRLDKRRPVPASIAIPVGFGIDPFHSGLLVLAVFVGNLTIKPATTPLIRWLGFRRLLLINGALNVASLLACALLTPQTPVWLIMLILYLGGVFRSVQLPASVRSLLPTFLPPR